MIRTDKEGNSNSNSFLGQVLSPGVYFSLVHEHQCACVPLPGVLASRLTAEFRKKLVVAHVLFLEAGASSGVISFVSFKGLFQPSACLCCPLGIPLVTDLGVLPMNSREEPFRGQMNDKCFS